MGCGSAKLSAIGQPETTLLPRRSFKSVQAVNVADLKSFACDSEGALARSAEPESEPQVILGVSASPVPSIASSLVTTVYAPAGDVAVSDAYAAALASIAGSVKETAPASLVADALCDDPDHVDVEDSDIAIVDVIDGKIATATPGRATIPILALPVPSDPPLQAPRHCVPPATTVSMLAPLAEDAQVLLAAPPVVPSRQMQKQLPQRNQACETTCCSAPLFKLCSRRTARSSC